MTITLANEEENASLREELEHFGVDQSINEGRNVYSKRGRYVELFLLSDHTSGLLGLIHAYPDYMGLKVGEIVKGRLRSSLEYGTILYPKATKNSVSLNEKQTQLFLYGRDIFKEGLPNGMQLGRKLVGDEHGRFIGFGIFDGKNLANVIDKGAYLRKYK